MHCRMPFQPTVFFGLVGVQIVQHDVQFAVRVGRHNLIHEIQKLSPPPPVVVARNDLSGSDVEGCEQGSSAVPLVSVAESIQSLAIGEAEPPLRTLQGLDRRLFVHTQHQSIFRRIQIQPHDIGRFGAEFRIRTDAPTPPSL